MNFGSVVEAVAPCLVVECITRPSAAVAVGKGRVVCSTESSKKVV